MAIDPARKNRMINKIYHSIRNQYPQSKPDVYLIRHTIPEEKLDDDIYRRNKLEFSRIKEGNSGKVLLIYKSPDKYFYPIHYQNINGTKESKETYLLDSEKIVNDLNILVGLTEKLHKSNN